LFINEEEKQTNIEIQITKSGW